MFAGGAFFVQPFGAPAELILFMQPIVQLKSLPHASMQAFTSKPPKHAFVSVPGLMQSSLDKDYKTNLY